MPFTVIMDLSKQTSLLYLVVILSIPIEKTMSTLDDNLANTSSATPRLISGKFGANKPVENEVYTTVRKEANIARLLNRTHTQDYSQPNLKVYSKYVAAVLEFARDDEYILCGGTLLLPDVVLISSSCRNIKKPIDFDKIIVFSSLTNRQQYSQRAYIQQWVTHPQYERSIYIVKHDIAVLHLEDKFKLSSNRSITPLSTSKLMRKYKFQSEDNEVICNFAFWPSDFVDWKNLTAEFGLMTISVFIVPRKLCRTLRLPVIISFEQFCGTISPDDSIAGNESGGPLICGNVQFGFFTRMTKTANNDTILIFTRVDLYEDFVKSYFPKVRYVDDFPEDRRAPKSGGIDEIKITLPGERSSAYAFRLSINHFTFLITIVEILNKS